MKPRRIHAAGHLALDRARYGLSLTKGGWRTLSEDVDPDDLINTKTVAALAERGLIVLCDDGRSATLRR